MAGINGISATQRAKVKDNFEAKLKKVEIAKKEENSRIRREFERKLRNTQRETKASADRRIANQEKDHTNQLRQMAYKHSNQIQNMQRDHEDEIQKMQKTHEAALKRQAENFKTSLRQQANELQDDYQNDLRNQDEKSRQRMNEKVKAMADNYAKTIRREQAVFDLQNAHTRHTYDTNIDKLKTENKDFQKQKENSMHEIIEDSKVEKENLVNKFKQQNGYLE
jgi:hypothetical protein